MIDMNMVIADNILCELKKQQKKKTELATALDISKQTIHKMLTGARSISAIELTQISRFLGTTMEQLTAVSPTFLNRNVTHVFMGQVNTPSAKEGIKIADELIDLYLFHSNAQKNAKKMSEWSSLL